MTGEGDSGRGDVRYCPDCGEQNLATAQYCQRCGIELSGRTPAPAEAEAPDQDPSSDEAERASGPPGDDTESAGPEYSKDDLTDGVSRRVWIKRGVVGTVLVGGGIFALSELGGSEHRLASSEAIVRNDKSVEGQSLNVDARFNLKAGTYYPYQLDPQPGYTYDISITVSSNTAIDVITVPVNQYNRYQDQNEDFGATVELTERSVESVTLETRVSSGEYRIILDNTGWIGASPSGVADVSFELVGEVVGASGANS